VSNKPMLPHVITEMRTRKRHIGHCSQCYGLRIIELDGTCQACGSTNVIEGVVEVGRTDEYGRV
jgi:DNA polymerase II large subunit